MICRHKILGSLKITQPKYFKAIIQYIFKIKNSQIKKYFEEGKIIVLC